MLYKAIVIPILIIAWATPGLCRSGAIQVCTDQNYWYPFSYAQQNEAKGIHIEIAAQALKNLGYAYKFSPLPWKRCLQTAGRGDFDAVLSASYNPQRAHRFIYPPDAADPRPSDWRITQVEYVVITLKGNDYGFEGDMRTLPHPVRSPLGYSIVNDLKDAGIRTVTSPDIRECMQQLILSGRGSVITPPQNARHLIREPRFAGKLKIHQHPVKSKSYFMVFSRQRGNLAKSEINSIWDEIRKLRSDHAYIDQLFRKYAQSGNAP